MYSGISIEPLYFIQVTGKCVAKEDISDPYGHFDAKGGRDFQGLYFKLVCSRNGKVKRFWLVIRIIIIPDEIYDTYVDFNDDLELDIYVYNVLIWKTSRWDFVFIIP